MTTTQKGVFSEREIKLIQNCKLYVDNDPGGLPGHNLLVVVAKLVDLLEAVMSVAPDEAMANITKYISKKYYPGNTQPEYSKALFDQIFGMFVGRNFIRRDVWSARRTAEEIATAQGRGVIYICPDETIRDAYGNVVAPTGTSLYNTQYSGCIPVSFGDMEDFHNWLDSIVEPEEDENG